jgi:hypothetical protein
MNVPHELVESAHGESTFDGQLNDRFGDPQGEDRSARCGNGDTSSHIGVNPPLCPVRFELLRLVNILDLHGKYHDIRHGANNRTISPVTFDSLD